MALPVDVRDLMRTGARFTEERSLPVGVAVFVEVDAPDTLIDAVRRELRPATAAVSLQVEAVELGAVPVLAAGTDVVIAVAGSGNVGLRQALAGPRRLRIPVVVVGLGDDAAHARLADALLQPTSDLVVRQEAEEAVARVGAWLADNLGSKRLALAHNFAFMRRAVAEDAVKTTALQNGLIGAVTPIPGADMPIMTANQVKMLLQIAAAYGQPLGIDRVRELVAVVASGYLLRAVARQALVTIPVLGWAIKGGISYTGTMAMGRVAVRYFEDGADLIQVTQYFGTLREAAMSRKGRRASRRLSDAEVTVLPVSDQPALVSASGGAYTVASTVAPVDAAQTVLHIGEDEPAGE